MSNQVFTNANRKYYALPSLNTYTLSGNLGVPALGDELIGFDTVGSVTDDTLYLLDPLEGAIEILQEGMYSINIILGVANVVSPTNNDMDFNATLTLTRTGPLNGLIVDSLMIREVARGASPGTSGRIVSLKYIGYLQYDDVLTCNVIDYSGDGVNVLAADSQLIINKIY